MSGYYDRLQGTNRLLRIRRLRNAVYVGLLVLGIVIAFFRMQEQGASLKPFFFPIDGVLEIALIIGLGAALIGLVFRYLEVNHVPRDKQKYLMAKSSMVRSFRTAGFAIGIAILLMLAITPSAASTLFADPPQVVALRPSMTEFVNFTSPDPLGLSFVTHAVVSVTSGQALVTVSRNNVPIRSLSLNATSYTFDIEPTMWASRANWALILRNSQATNTSVIFILQKGIVPTVFSTLPFLLFLYGGVEMGWWFALRPVRDRTKVAAEEAAAELDEGERIYDPNAPIASHPTPSPNTEMALNFAAAPVAPPVKTAPPPAPAATARASPAEPPRIEPTQVAPPRPAPAPRPPVRPPDTAGSLATKASGLVTAGAYEPALTAFNEALRIDPTHVGALRGRADSLARLNRKPEALETYQRILARDPRNIEALRWVSRQLAEDRRWRDCLESVDALLRIRPNESAALEMRGDALTNLGRRPEALAAYEASAALDESNENVRQKIEEVRVDVPSLLSRALIASASGNYPQALILFDDILEVEPSNVNALIGKAVAYRRSGKPQEALNCLDLVLGVQHNNASALLNRGNIMIEEGDLEGALDSFDRLTQLYPMDEEAWAAQGDVLVKMGRNEDALRAYTEAQKLSPGDEGIQRHILELEAAKGVAADILQELLRVKGVGQTRAKALVDAGFHTPEDIASASPKDLTVVKGITRKIAEELIEHFRNGLSETTEPAPEQVLK
ncbi:MAG TPA: tetratricopeptide repeat protein [Thermoplasmata archaeon]|nr:tetratricopeptide repeat protein [Thermoplasmata archaeon]